MDYRPRVVDGRLKALLRVMGGVVLEGPRACGKTSTGLQQAASSIRLDTPASAQLADFDPLGALQGPAPRLIDEWQLEP